MVTHSIAVTVRGPDSALATPVAKRVPAERPAPVTRVIDQPIHGLGGHCPCGGGCPTCDAGASELTVLQPRLLVSQPDPVLEPEADRIAGAAMGARGASGAYPWQASLSARPSPSSPLLAPPVVHEVIRSIGHPLEAGTRAVLEPILGMDFSDVRLHTDQRAAASAQALEAQAYTVGNHIVFGEARYEPSTPAGLELIAHELAHVVQQRSALAVSVVQRALVYSSGYPRPFHSDAAEVRCVEAQRSVCRWFPSSVDFAATAQRSGGGVGRATFATLLSFIESQSIGSITELGLIGHANPFTFPPPRRPHCPGRKLGRPMPGGPSMRRFDDSEDPMTSAEPRCSDGYHVGVGGQKSVP